MNEPQVRRAVSTDLPALLELYGHLHPDEPPPPLAEAASVMEEILGSTSTCIFVVESAEGALLSSRSLAVVPNLTRGAKPLGVIENVVTHAEHRKCGYGREVLRAACEAAREMGCYKVFLATGFKQEATLKFYENAGFKRDTKIYFEVR